MKSPTSARTLASDLQSGKPSNVGRALKTLVRLGASRDALAKALGLDQTPTIDASGKIRMLDGPLAKCVRKLPSELLADFFAASFRRADDNYQASLIAVTELVRRRDVPGELNVVGSFSKALKAYDAGHRAGANTVHQRLCSKLFPKFEAEPLAALLRWCSDDLLSTDEMRELFLPAFAKADHKVERVLLKRLEKYLDALAELGREREARAFLQRVSRKASPAARKAMAAREVGAKAAVDVAAAVRRGRRLGSLELGAKDLLTLGRADGSDDLVGWALLSRSLPQLRALLEELQAVEGFGPPTAGRIMTLLAERDPAWLREWIERARQGSDASQLYARQAIGHAVSFVLEDSAEKLATPADSRTEELDELHAALCGQKLVKLETGWEWVDVTTLADPQALKREALGRAIEEIKLNQDEPDQETIVELLRSLAALDPSEPGALQLFDDACSAMASVFYCCHEYGYEEGPDLFDPVLEFLEARKGIALAPRTRERLLRSMLTLALRDEAAVTRITSTLLADSPRFEYVSDKLTTPYVIACAYASISNAALALRYVEAALAAGQDKKSFRPVDTDLQDDPFESLRSHPRFKQLTA
ncbi:MAG: hypothetical protein QM765_33730 [Myxococcales bacterium]